MARFRDEITHELEGKVLFVTAKSRLIEDNFTGKKYFIPKKCTIDFNDADDNGNVLFVVSDWWWKKRDEFEAAD